MTRTSGIFLLTFAILLALLQIGGLIATDYSFKRDIMSHWSLADKSSTIEAKSQHIQAMIQAIHARSAPYSGKFAQHNAVVLTTPQNSFQGNFEALKTLGTRLSEIQKMDPKTFEYNTAISQITAQEQGEANELIGTLDGCYTLKCWPIAWDWIGLLVLILWLVFGCIGIAIILEDL